MITSIDVEKWQPFEVNQWLRGLCDDVSWFDADYIVKEKLGGKHLLMFTAKELCSIGATKVDLQEHILEAIDKLRHYNSNVSSETIQLAILRLACQSRSLQNQLVASRQRACNDDKLITLTRDFQNKDLNSKPPKHRVELDTLACVSDMVKTIRDITEVINRSPFSKYEIYRTMKSLILALSIELTSTAQRDQFVVRPNDVLEKSSKELADFCDLAVKQTKDVLLIQPFQMRTVRVRKSPGENSFGFTIKSVPGCHHRIDKITPLSAAKKTNELSEGDEIISINQFIVGWTKTNVQHLLEESTRSNDITLVVKKNPSDL